MKNNYWTSEQDELMKIIYTTDSNTKEWLIAFKKIYPVLKYMAEIILRRYYKVVSTNKEEELISDAITKLIMNGNYNEDKPKLYSYCGTILKRHFHDEIVRDLSHDNNENEISIDEHEFLLNELSTNNYEYNNEKLEFLLNKLELGRNECVKKLKKCKKSKYKFSKRIVSINQEIEFIDVSTEYFTKYFNSIGIGTVSLSEYLYFNCGETPEYTHRALMVKYFNFGSNYYKLKEDRKYDTINKYNISYIQDDYTPEDKYYSRNAKRKTHKDKYDYF